MGTSIKFPHNRKDVVKMKTRKINMDKVSVMGLAITGVLVIANLISRSIAVMVISATIANAIIAAAMYLELKIQKGEFKYERGFLYVPTKTRAKKERASHKLTPEEEELLDDYKELLKRYSA